MAESARTYLNKKETVSSLTTNHKMLKINNHEVETRPMIQPANVFPAIPNTGIENKLKKKLYTIMFLDNITKSRFNLKYSHILNFRRQIIVPDDVKKIPYFFVISIEDIIYHTESSPL